jgi:hypothetical protein
MIGYAAIVGTFGSSFYFADSNSLGMFLCFIKMPFVPSSSNPDQVYTREVTVTRLSTEIDPGTGLIPADEVVFRTRHIDRRRWGGTFAWERKTTTGFLPPYTHRFTWIAGVPFPANTPEARKRFYDPFVLVKNDPPGYVDVVSSDSSPESYLDAVRSTLTGQEVASNGWYSAEPEWCFFPVEIKQGQYLRGVTTWYKESAVSYDSGAGAYTSPLLDDAVPVSGPSNSEDLVTPLGSFGTLIYLLRI